MTEDCDRSGGQRRFLRHMAAACAVPWLSAAPVLAGVAAAQSMQPAPAPPVDRSKRPQTGEASFYGAKEAGRPTASGEPLKLGEMTAASRTLPLGTQAKVVNLETGKSTQVRVNDRGPYAHNRVLDVTPKAAKALGMEDKGVAPVVVAPVSEPPPKPAGDRRP